MFTTDIYIWRSFFVDKLIDYCMQLNFLPPDMLSAVRNLNINFLTELRLRKGQPVMAEYSGEYKYLCPGGVTDRHESAIRCADVVPVLNAAMGGCVYSFAEQLKNGFITVSGGVRIGIAGEYVTEHGQVKTIARATSLNIRIPHAAEGCSDYLFGCLMRGKVVSALLYSKPGLGKTTLLRDIARNISRRFRLNVLVLDTRNELGGNGEYGLGETCDVVNSCDKLGALGSAVRAMKPDVIITDELYGDDDIAAVRFARDCGIEVIASSHVCEHSVLAALPFDYYIKLNGIGLIPDIYDKNFDLVCNNCPDYVCRRAAFGGKEEEGGGVRRAVRI